MQIDVIHVMSTRVLWILHQPRRRWPNPRGSVSPKSTGRDFFLTLLSEYSSSVDMHVDIFYLFYLIAFCMASQLIYPITSYFLLFDSDLRDPESMFLMDEVLHPCEIDRLAPTRVLVTQISDWGWYNLM